MTKSPPGFSTRLMSSNACCGEKIALEPDVGVAAVENERIHQRIDDEIVLTLGSSKEMPSVVEMTLDARVVVRPVGILGDADSLDLRIDFDRVDMPRPITQCMVDVIAGSCADDQHVLEGRSAGRSVEQVDKGIRGAALVERDDLLVADIVDRDLQIVGSKVDRVIGRPGDLVPGMPSMHPLNRNRRHDAGQREDARPRQSMGFAQQVSDAGAADEKPDPWRGVRKGQG